MSGLRIPRRAASDAPDAGGGATTRTAAIPRGLLIIVGVAAALGAALGMRAFSTVIGPLFLAVVLSIVVHPLRRLSDRFSLPAWVGIVLSLVAVYGIVAGLLVILVISGVQLAALLDDFAPQFQASVDGLAETLAGLGVSQEQLQAVASGFDPGKLVDFAVGLLGGLAGVLSSVFFLVLLLFFTVTDASSFALRLTEISPVGQRLGSAFQLFARGSRHYLVVATVFGAVVALLDFVALIILDIRYAWLWALLAFVTNFIPNVGFILGLIPPTIVALVDHDPGTALAVVVIYTVLNVVIQSVIQPRVVGNAVGLSATLSFISLVVWTSVIGPVGAVLAVPATLFVKAIFVDVDPDNRWVEPLLSNAPAAEEPIPETVETVAVAPSEPPAPADAKRPE